MARVEMYEVRRGSGSKGVEARATFRVSVLVRWDGRVRCGQRCERGKLGEARCLFSGWEWDPGRSGHFRFRPAGAQAKFAAGWGKLRRRPPRPSWGGRRGRE